MNISYDMMIIGIKEKYYMYNDYWNQVWNTDDLDEYRNYIEKYEHIQNDMIDILKKHRV